ncbi:MAG: hypothetical protein ABIZ91_14705 [Gemmatimonadaceae bacterium]
MSTTLRVYVNGRGVDAPAAATANDAVRIFDTTLADEVAAGDRLITDSRGLPIASDTALHGGAIFRVIPNRQRGSASGEA